MLGKPSRRTRKRLEEAGKPAMATVVEIAEKGMAVTHGAEGVIGNTELALKTKLKVQPQDEPEFEVEETFRYPQLGVPAVGQQLAVIFDPEDHDKVMLDESQEAQTSAALAGTGLMAAMQQQQQALNANMGLGVGPAGSQDPVDKLEKLQDLKEKGALTDAEFAAQKARILGES